MTQILDYSFARPDPAAIKAAGYIGVVRYLSHDVTKALSAPEKDALLAAGLDIWLNFEDYSTNAQGGYRQGFADGQFAASEAAALGAPKGMGIYFSVDYDTLGTYPQAVDDYLRGCADGMAGRYNVGDYGSVFVVNGAQKAHRAAHGWMTLAWSRGAAPAGDLYQDGSQVFNGGADVDQVLSTPSGSWLQTLNGDDDMTPEQDTALFVNGVAPGQTSVGGTIVANLETSQKTYNEIEALKAGQADLAAKIAALSTTPVDVSALAAALVPLIVDHLKVGLTSV